MRDFDKKIATFENVTYYCRYVDDIIIVITPKNRNENKTISNYKTELKNIVLKSTLLNINSTKTTFIDLRKENNDRKNSKDYELTYLGYKFIIGYKKDKKNIVKKPLRILMSDSKFERYINKIKSSFEDFNNEIAKYTSNQSGINRLLPQRMKFLTNNFQLVRRKDNVFVGVYYSNEFINDYSNLTELDKILKNQITLITPIGKLTLINKLKQLSFHNGFKEKSFLKFNFRAFQNEKVLKIWKNF